MDPFLKAMLVAVPFAFVYFVMRSIPVTPCDFLHEETYNAEGVVDYCGGGDSAFVDLSLRKWPLSLEFRPLGEIVPGKPCDFRLDITQFDGSPLTAEEVALSHTKKIHLLAVDESLADYHHVHPEPDSLNGGVWYFTLTPENAGKYAIFLDFIPIRSPRRVLLTSSFNVKGDRVSVPGVQEKLAFSSGNRFFELKKDKSGDEIRLEFHASDQNGKSLGFQPVMGAFAHMVAFDGDLKGFAHLHPEENLLPVGEGDLHEGPLSFTFTPPKQGLYRLWAQVRFAGEPETFIPFDLKVGS